jgi:hypothetical protein
MGGTSLDAQERERLCELLDELGPSASTLLEGWTAQDLAAHLVQREHDLIAAPCLVLPGPFHRFAERRRVRLAAREQFGPMVAAIRSGPPWGFFRIGWVRSFPNLNEYFVHHVDRALWWNARRGSRYLGRRLRGAGLELEWAGTGERFTARRGEPIARLSGGPGELLLYLFGRGRVAQVGLTGSPDAVAAVERTDFGI